MKSLLPLNYIWMSGHEPLPRTLLDFTTLMVLRTFFMVLHKGLSVRNQWRIFFLTLVFNNSCISYKLLASFLSYKHCKFWNQPCVPLGVLCYKTQSRQVHDPYLPGWASGLGIGEAREAPRAQRPRTHSGCLTCPALTLQSLTSCSMVTNSPEFTSYLISSPFPHLCVYVSCMWF